MKKIIRLEFSNVEIAQGDPDFALSHYPMGILTKMMLRANEIGLEGKKIQVVEVGENFEQGRKYIDFITVSNPQGK